jgi:uncharacterized phiE125 gp8 family phage protein
MGVWSVTAPALEPIDLADAKLAARIADDQTELDGLITMLITAGREWAENFTGRAFITQTWERKYDLGFPDEIELPKPPVQSVTSVTYIDGNGVTQTLSPSLYITSLSTGPYAMPGRIVPAYGQSWPSTRSVPDAVTVRYVCGYGSTGDSVPEAIKLAIKIQISTRLANTEGVVVGTSASLLPQGDEYLLWPFKVY